MKVFIKAETTGYEGNGEYWVRVADDKLSRIMDEDYIIKDELGTSILLEEVTGTLGQILDEVELPPDIQEQVEELYEKAVKLL